MGNELPMLRDSAHADAERWMYELWINDIKCL